MGLESEFAFKLGELAAVMEGGFSTEHEIGRAKVDLADRLQDPVERKLMFCLKNALDEDTNLNPGVLVSTKYG